MEGKMEDIKNDIINLLSTSEQLCISEIASTLKKGKNTVSKYLSILEAEGRVKSIKKKPYIFWNLN
jgi:Mn-dependent DtxR family transcriptional regulator